jgi:uncharacterized protein YggE
MAELAVSGSARRLVPPDRGTARVRVELEGPHRDDVVRAARALHERLAQDAGRYTEAGAAADWSADQLWVSTTQRWRGEKKEPGRVVVASAAIRVTFVDLAALGAWLTEVAQLDGAAVHGVEWGLADERRREIEREVRAEALLDAQDRARAYAEAVGLRTVTLRRVFEPGLRTGDEDGGPVMHRASAAMLAGPAEPDFELRPQELDIRATVSADFSAE